MKLFRDCHCEVVGVNPSCFVEDSFVEYIQEALCNDRHVESDTWIIGTMFDFDFLAHLTNVCGPSCGNYVLNVNV